MKTLTPSVSVIVPVRNGQRTLGDCIKSILRTEHSLECWEVLVVDNGSTDGTARIIRSYPVTYLWEPRRGPSYARNRGIEASRGEIIVFTDADCVVSTGWLKAVVQEFTDENVWGVAGEIVAYPPKTPAERYTAMKRSLHQKAALNSRRPYAVTGNVAFRRETFDRIGCFDPRFITGQDQELSRRFFAAGLKLNYSAEALVFHRHRSTAWAFFKQHLGWGYGAVLLNNYYLLVECKDLTRSLWAFAKAGIGYGIKGGDAMDVYYPYFDVLRVVARGLGAVHCWLSMICTRRFE